MQCKSPVSFQNVLFSVSDFISIWHITEHTRIHFHFVFLTLMITAVISCYQNLSAMACNVTKPVGRPQRYYDFDPC